MDQPCYSGGGGNTLTSQHWCSSARGICPWVPSKHRGTQPLEHSLKAHAHISIGGHIFLQPLHHLLSQGLIKEVMKDAPRVLFILTPVLPGLTCNVLQIQRKGWPRELRDLRVSAGRCQSARCPTKPRPDRWVSPGFQKHFARTERP